MARTTRATTQVAFLRGINLAKNTRISMADLAALVRDLGYEDVRTHLQSGNVIYRTGVAPARAAAAIEHAVEDVLRLTVPVVARTRDELAEVVAADPLGPMVTDQSRYLVVFLDRKPAKAGVDKVAAAAGPGEEVRVVGRELYAWMPGGVHSSKVGAALGRDALGVLWTGRNWRTVTKVFQLMGD